MVFECDAVQNVDSRIVGKTKAANGSIYTSQDHTSDVFVRNPDVWCSDIDLTCISPSNSNANSRKSGYTNYSRHIVNASHYEFNVGTRVYFVSQDGNNTVYESC